MPVVSGYPLLDQLIQKPKKPEGSAIYYEITFFGEIDLVTRVSQLIDEKAFTAEGDSVFAVLSSV